MQTNDFQPILTDLEGFETSEELHHALIARARKSVKEGRTIDHDRLFKELDRLIAQTQGTQAPSGGVCESDS